jgi:hypothetical protein
MSRTKIKKLKGRKGKEKTHPVVNAKGRQQDEGGN